jgi:hypothetical protein
MAAWDSRAPELPYCQRRLRLCRELSAVPGVQKEGRKNPGLEPDLTATSVDQEWHQKLSMRNESLDFLVRGSGGGLDYTSVPPETDNSVGSISRGRLKASTQLATPIIEASDPLVVEWTRQCLDASSKQDWNKLKDLLNEAAKYNYLPYVLTLRRLLDELKHFQKYHLTLQLFQLFESSLKVDKNSVCHAIDAAFKQRSYQLCEELFSKYMGVAMHDTSTQLTMLKCFIANYNLTVARAFLEQIWDSVINEHIDVYIIGISFVARNAKELQRVLKLWMDACNGVIAPQTLALSLTGFLHLGDDASFADCLFTAKDLGILDSPKIQKVLLEKALLIKDAESFGKTVKYMTAKHIPLSQSPFRRAIVYFCKRSDMSGVSYTCKLMIHHGFEVDTKIFNTLLLAGVANQPRFNIVNYLEEGSKAGILRNRSTLEYIRQALVKKYARRGDYINDIYVEGLKNLGDSDEWINERIPHMKVLKVAKTGRFVVVPLGEPPSISMLRQLQRDIWFEKPEVSMKSIEDLLRQGIIPSRALFLTAMTAFLKKKTMADFDTLVHKYAECGHKVDANVELLLLRREILKYPLDIPLQTYTNNLVRVFLANYPNLRLEKRVTLGYLLFEAGSYDDAVSVFDSKRVSGERVGSANHTSDSLTGLLRCLDAKMDLASAVKLVRDILDGDRDIDLHAGFFNVLRGCQRKAELNSDSLLAAEFQELTSLCSLYQKEYYEKAEMTVKSTLRILKQWKSTSEDEASDDETMESVERELNLSYTTTL